MRTLTLLLLTVLGVPFQLASAQEIDPPEGAVIESAEVSGFALDQLSPGLQRDIDALTGERLNRERLGQLAARIEEEHPEVVAAVRSVSRPDGRAKVIFLVARISDDGHLVSNINARYIVESVKIWGVPESTVNQSLRDRLQALVGHRLDPEEAERLNEELKAELPGHDVQRRIARGSEPGRIRVVFDVKEKAWIPFTPTKSKFVYHGHLGWSGALDIPMGNDSGRVTVGFVFDDKDDLIETYSGFRIRVESPKIGTTRLGAGVEVSRFHPSWRDTTLTAMASDPDIPEPYRGRLTVAPFVTFAFNPHVRLTGGVSISELESLFRPPESQMASAWLASVGYDQRWRLDADSSQKVEASYQLRAATEALDSDLTYKRHLGHARYEYRRRDNRLTAAFSIGYITGRAPLFERFSLGDTSTLRGWNKYDLAPAGGDRMFHQSLEYTFHDVGVFLDTGSVWTTDVEQRIRLSTGFGVHGDNAFLLVGFPLNADNAGATFMMGVRF